MIVFDIGIVGTGLWEGEIIDNEKLTALGWTPSGQAQVKDPFRGRQTDDGTVHIAGLELNRAEYPRTLAALRASFSDPYRGTRRRRRFPTQLRVSEAETEAARHALDDAGIAPNEIGAVLVQSFLPDEIQPRNAALVAHALGITRAPAWEVDSICNSAITHLSVASALITSGLADNVLCVQSTAYSRVSDPWSSSFVQEGDMASAFVVARSPGTRMAVSWRTDGRLHAAIRLQWRAPADAPARRWWEASRDRLVIEFDSELQTQVMREIACNARTVCNEALGRCELRCEHLDILIAHQPMSWNRAFMEDVLGLRDGVAFDTFEEYGSINSCGIPASIHHARRSRRLRRGTRTLLFGPAAGYTFGAVALEW